MIFRKITEDEKRLLIYLVNKSNINLPANWIDQLKVSEMNDGGMGSLYLSTTLDDKSKKRRYEKTISECYFDDSDGVCVIASLNIDHQGNIYELDIWKTDFSRLLTISKSFSDIDYI